jgi:hypothetical protein
MMTDGWKTNADALWRQSSRLPGVSNRAFRHDFIRWILEKKPNLFLTLTLPLNQDFVRFHTQADKFMGSIMQRAYGREWPKRSYRIRPFAMGFLEHPHTNPHYHILIHANVTVTDALLNYSQDMWARFMKFDHVHIEHIINDRDAISYCSKEQITLEHFASAWIWGPIPSK